MGKSERTRGQGREVSAEAQRKQMVLVSEEGAFHTQLQSWSLI